MAYANGAQQSEPQPTPPPQPAPEPTILERGNGASVIWPQDGHQ